MPLSTSNSRPPRKRATGRILLLLLAMFLALEWFTRAKLFPMSKDFVRFATYSARARALGERPGLRLAFVGNSVTERGVNIPLLTREAQRTYGVAVSADMFVADASKINTWYYIVNSYFWRPSRHPDLLVITFCERELEDGNQIDIGRLAQFFTKREDWDAVFENDLPAWPDRADFVLSSYSATLAARDRIKDRILAAVAPDYKDFVRQVNEVNFHHRRGAPTPARPAPRTHHALQRLLAAAARNGTRICFVAFPTHERGPDETYDLNPETVRLIRAAGMEFIDMRGTPGLTPDKFADEMHLTPDGASIYSLALTRNIEPVLERTRASLARASR